MRRPFRLYQKKRGHRRTGSTRWGSVGEAVFGSVFLLVGIAALAAMLNWLVIPEWRANRHFTETTCLILGGQVGVTGERGDQSYRPEIHIRYEVDGREYLATTYDVAGMYSSNKQWAENAVKEVVPGQRYYCWYDPINPSRAVLVRGYSGWLYLILLIPISFIAIGGGGLVYTLFHWNTSAERRAAISQQRAQVDLFEANVPTNRDFPSIPADENLTNSPGVRLAYRLPVTAGPGWTLFALTIACLFWNGVVAAFAIAGFLSGEGGWLFTLFLFPFIVIGGGLLAYLARQLLFTAGFGTTRIEISDHPLNPGETYDLVIAQAGRLAMDKLELLLVCEEKATYNQGTDTRTEVRRVFEESVFCKTQFQIEQTLPFEEVCRMRIPQTAMHSLKADHNEINWRLVVRGQVSGWPDYERQFPVIVYPGDHGTSA